VAGKQRDIHIRRSSRRFGVVVSKVRSPDVEDEVDECIELRLVGINTDQIVNRLLGSSHILLQKIGRLRICDAALV
jgi:hypothetical protein